jgi:hypothetical protein
VQFRWSLIFSQSGNPVQRGEVRESSSKPWKQIADTSLNGKDIDNYEICFEAYTWGSYESIGIMNSTSTVKINNVDEFDSYYYGYVAADPPK